MKQRLSFVLLGTLMALVALFATTTASAQITVGTVITLQPYDTNIIPPQVADYDAATISTVTSAGSRYVVTGNRVVYVGNESFTLVIVEAVYSWMPIKNIEWPAYYTKIAFPGGISKSYR